MDYTITSEVHLRLYRPNGEGVKTYFVPWFGDGDSRSAVEIYTWYRKLYRAKRKYNGRLEVVSVQYVIPYELNMIVFWRLLDFQDKYIQEGIKRKLYEELLYEKILRNRERLKGPTIKNLS